jgi:hypothetical protein
VRSRPSLEKRRREASRKERQADKTERRAERRRAKDERTAAAAPGEDPDLVGIVAGPQPVRDDDDGEDGGTP